MGAAEEIFSDGGFEHLYCEFCPNTLGKELTHTIDRRRGYVSLGILRRLKCADDLQAV